MDTNQVKVHRKKTMFVDGPVTPEFIATAIAKHSSNTAIGAHQIFLGQIRADVIDQKMVMAIEFTAYREMADDAYAIFRESLFSKYSLTCMHVYHSVGRVNAGEVNLFVFVSSVHRKDATAACAELVEWIKKEAPVWGKEILSDDQVHWKVNT
jgi:molybdopterin synthase catalytic subunit